MQYSYEAEFRFTVSHDVKSSEALLHQGQSSYTESADGNR